MPSPESVLVDLSDFDAVGIVGDVVVSVRSHAIESATDTSATVSAPDGWHAVVINCSSTGNVVLRARFEQLSRSRVNNVSKALIAKGWQIDEDQGGASSRQAPGTEATTVAFEILAALTVAGAPSDTRSVIGRDGTGSEIALA